MRTPPLEPLETRLLYNADAALWAGTPLLAEVRAAEDTATPRPPASAPDARVRGSWLVADRRAEDWDLALADLQARTPAGATPTLLQIDPDADGAAALARLRAQATPDSPIEILPWQAGDGTWLGQSRLDAPESAATGPAPEALRFTPAPARGAGTELVIIDAAVPDAERLLADVARERAGGRAIEAVVLDPDRDGLSQITDLLSARSGLAAVHLVSHGGDGALQLGNTTLDTRHLLDQADQLTRWRQALSETADLLLYGCDVAGSTAGREFVATLSALSGADVAASTDPTGAAAAGGDWDLEFRVGQIEQSVAFSTAAQSAWDGTLGSYTVTNLNDSGAGSLRQALIDANTNGGADSIVFTAHGTINLSSALPDITGPVSIDGTNAGAPGIVLHNSASIATGLYLRAGSDGSTVRGLVIQGFTGQGIKVENAADVTIAGNYIGTDAAGNVAAGNTIGIDLWNTLRATIGGTAAADRNVISGNSNIGVNILGAAAGSPDLQIQVLGNYIGTNASGSADLGNTWHGIFVDHVAGVTVGGTAAGAGNVISGNGSGGGGHGVTIYVDATDVTVQGNTIGLNVLGSGVLGNGGNGITIYGSGNTLGGTTAAARNVISANGVLGIQLTGTGATGNTIVGNYIGTGASGITDLGNTEDGIQLDSGASNNIIGGTTTGALNVIAGNNNAGIAIDHAATTGNQVLGNWIGVGSNGTTALANSHNGINIGGATGTLIGDGTVAGRNVIASNTLHGIGITDATGTLVRSNWIGYNGSSGINVAGTASGTVIGGDDAVSANLIAHNTVKGILVTASSSSAASILSNQIFANGDRGIDLNNNGYDTNDVGDADGGPNGLQNYPVLTSAASTTSGTTFVGTLNSAAGQTYRIDLYANRPADVDGSHGEGARWLGYFTVTTNGSGNASFNQLLGDAWVSQGDLVTAVATLDLGGGNYGGSSEFAANVTATATGVVVVDTTADTVDGTTTSLANLGNARGGDGRISLREAITAANNTANGASPDRIVFAIPPAIESLDYLAAQATPVITLTSALPSITQAVVIDASTQPGFAGSSMVQLRGNGTVASGLTLAAGSTGSTVRGLIIGNFTTAGIQVTGGNSHTIAGNWIGLDTDGVTTDANARGIILSNSTGTTIGGTAAADRNVISGNTGEQLYLNGAVNSIVYGNYVGTDVTGMLDVDGSTYAAGKSGIAIDGASTGNQIGNTIAGARNVISGNNWMGVDIVWSGSVNNTISGNYIGTDATGLAALANAGGVSFWGSGTGNQVVANVLSGNAGAGVGAGNGSTGAVIQGNLIGLGADGSTALGNGAEGVVIYGGATGTTIGTNSDGSNDAAERNVIAANTIGILVMDAGTANVQIKGNYIGTDSTGLLARGNTNDGIALLDGVSDITIGGTSAVERNVISANTTEGLWIDADNVTVQGNYIGLDATGTAALANGSYGIDVAVNGSNVNVGGAAAGAGNVISGNDNAGVLFEAGSTGSIKGNRIGTDATGTVAIAGNGAGVWLATDNVQVGGTAAGEGNTITGSNTAGIVVAGTATGNALLGNSIYGNGGLSIDLGADGVSANDAAPDADTGANGLQNFPVLSSVITTGSAVAVSGTLDTGTSGYWRIEFYADSSGDASGHGEARTYLGSLNVSTDASGHAAFATSLAVALPAGYVVSATATASDASYSTFGSTSELSAYATAITLQAPVNTVPGAQTTAEDTARVFSSANGNAISIADGDAAGAENQISLSVTNGALTLAGTAGLTFVSGDGTADTSMVVRGTAAALNAALDGLSFTPTADYSGGAVLTLATTDSLLLSLDIDTGLLGRYAFDQTGNLGADTSPTAGHAAAVAGGSSVVDGTRGTVIDLDGGATSHLQITGRFGDPATLTLAAWVRLDLADSAGAEVLSLGDRVLLRLDQGGLLKGCFNDGAGYRFTEGAATLAGTGWHHVAYTIDASNHTQTLYLDGQILAETGYTGAIAYAGGGSDTTLGTHGNGATTVDFDGQIDEARVYNRALTAAEVATLADDLAMVATDTVALTVTAVNDAPTITNGASIGLGASYSEDGPTAGFLVSGIINAAGWADADAGASHGLVLTGVTGLGGWEYSTDGSTWQGVGSVSASNGLLLDPTAWLRYVPDGSHGESPTITYRAWDGSSGTASGTGTPSYADPGAGGGSTAFSSASATGHTTINDVNDAPVATIGAAGYSATEQTVLVLQGTGLSVADVDAGSNVVQATVSVTDGVLNAAAGSTGVSLAGSGTSTVTLTGTLAQINALLAGTGGATLGFLHNGDNPPASVTLSLGVSDLGSTGSGGTLTATDTATITLTPANDTPSAVVATRYLSELTPVAVSMYDLTLDIGHASNPIVLDGVSYARGLGTHPGATGDGSGYVDYAVDGATTFKATLGVNDYQAGPYGSVRFQVYLDGVLAYSSGTFDSDTPTVELDLDVTGATTLRLVVDNANDGNAFDHGVWANARLEGGSVALATLSEGCANGTAVGSVVGVDVDTPENWSYTLVDDAGGRFAIDASTGRITVADGSLLDREVAASHAITVRATDSGGQHVDQVFTIALTDVDEFDVTAPSDANASGNAVAENAANGTVVGLTAQASDADATTNGVTYTLVDDAGGRFAIDANTGVVTVADGSLLDREAAASHSITVRAISQDGSTADQVFTIALTDVDEFDVTAPSDGDATANTVAENAANGTVVGLTAQASDADATTHGISYSLVDDAGGRFAIDVNTGVVTVADGSLLDRETAASHSITVRATSQDGSIADQVFTIALADVDEFDVTAPSDANASANAVAENAANGTVVGLTAQANDADVATNAISYSLVDDAGGRFAIDANTGVVTVADGTLLDRDAAASHNITVRATSQDGSIADQVFTIALSDVDEFDVTAPGDANASANAVAENAASGTVVGLTAQASDADATNNAVSYSLVDDAGGRFAIDVNTGVVTVADGTLLDREAAASHSITVRATSQDGSIADQVFTIALTDVDEFDVTVPADSNGSVNAVAENAASGTAIGITAQAADADITTHGVTYTLVDDAGGRFAIDANTGVVTVADGSLLDREAAASHSITVRATSQDGSTADQVFAIALTDVDEFDVTVPSDGNASANAVAENAASGTAVGITALAADADATTHGVTYTLVDDAGGRFAIDANTGIVTVADGSLLDREAAASHSITVRATSQDGSIADQVFTIALTDVDEFDVTAPSDGNASANTVAENAANGTVVGITALAADADATTHAISYSLVDDAGGRFAIDAHTGVVTVADGSLLNREAAASHSITVRATSQDGSIADQVFTIALTDVDEFDVTAPSDGDATANTVAENAANGTVVGLTAQATDSDATTHGISYSLVDDAGGRFAIDANTGVVTVADGTLLDREAATSHSITVRATSQDGSIADQVFTIALTDVDEFDVTIPSDGNASANTVAENAANGTVVGITAQAGDADATTRGISYNLVDDAGGRFAIDAHTGVITVADGSLLDREASANHSVTVRATSQDGSTADQVFSIAIGDVDEFDVTVPGDTDAGANTVAENATSGTVVGITAQASDADATTHGIHYSLVDDAGGRFAIDAHSGVVTVADGSLLDREAATSHSITVRATSQDGSIADQVFTISLTDVDEFDVTAPSDANASANTVAENAANGTVVGLTAQATDADATTHGVSYTLVDDAGGRFAIDANTGVVTVADGSLLDREASANHSVTVRATSQDGSTADQVFSIAIGDVDEFDVTVPGDTDAGANTVAENATSGTVVGITAQASDADATTHGIHYSLVDDAGGRFAIDAHTGVVSVADGTLLDREAADRWTISVRATSDDGSWSDRDWTVDLLDLNEAAPQFVSHAGAAQASVTVAENTLAVDTLLAVDSDRTAPAVSYAIAGGADAAHFTIDPVHGTLQFRAAPDRETPTDADHDNVYLVQVLASDGERSSVQTLAVAVANVDEAPDVVVSPTTIVQGDTVVVSGRWMAVGDVDTGAQDLVFTVTATLHGHFAPADQPDTVLQQFSWADIQAGRVGFHHDGSNQDANWSLQLSDGSNRRELQSTTAVRARDYVDAGTPGSGGTTSTPTPGSTTRTTPTPTGTTTAPPPEESASSQVIVPEVRRALPMEEGRPDPSTMVEPFDEPGHHRVQDGSAEGAPTERHRSGSADVTGPSVPSGGVMTIAFGGVEPGAPLADPGEEALIRLDPGGRGLTGPAERPNLPRSGSNRAAAEPEDDAASAPGDAPLLHVAPEDLARAGGVAFSLGALFWVSRAGGLVSSLLMSLPAWRQLDPLPIMSAAGPTPASRRVSAGAEATDTVGDFDALADDILERAAVRAVTP